MSSSSNQAADPPAAVTSINLPPLPVQEGLVSPESFVQSLPDHHPSGPDPPLCTICRSSEVNSSNNPLKELPCGHKFHRDCLLRWLMRADTCPICRSKLPVDPDRPDLTNARWVSMGQAGWRLVVDGPGHWILRRSSDDFMMGNEFTMASPMSGQSSDPTYSPSSPWNRTMSPTSSYNPNSPLDGPASPNYSPDNTPDRQTPDE